MPFSLFECHTMGLSPMPGYDRPKQSVQRFSFNFPSGKKWTLSKADDTRARQFYCGGGPVVEPPVVQNPTPMDAIYCTGGEGAWDGTPTYWMSSARKGCKTNNQGEAMPYGQQISREEYDRRGRTLCADGTYDENLNPWSPKCQGHGGYPGTTPTTGGTGPIVDIVPQLVDGIGCPTNLRKDTDENFIAYNLAKYTGNLIGKRNLPAFCNKDTRQYVSNNLPELEFEGAWMQTAIGGRDNDGYIWSGQTNQLLRKKCPATFKKLYDIANAEYQRTLGSSNCMTSLPIQIRTR